MNYPNGSKKKFEDVVTYANRGMGLEEDLNVTNEYYLENDVAVIHKKPTPIVIYKVDYPSRKEAIIREAKFKIPSTTDYNGIYKGKYLDFEAKETSNKTNFPISNIHEHQLNHLRNIIAHGGIGFLIVRFTSFNKTYFLSGENLFHFLDTEKRKSIPIEFFEKHGILIPIGLRPRLNYLNAIEVDNEKY
jgi:recombination protein U